LVTDLLYETAVAQLTNVGLEVATVVREVSRNSPTIGKITDQQPTAYQAVEIGSAVTITVDQIRTIEVPNLIGLSVSDAQAQLSALGLGTMTSMYCAIPDGFSAGYVYDQSPAAGGTALDGAMVTIRVGGYC
jgi:serine/threonine-protein kinase